MGILSRATDLEKDLKVVEDAVAYIEDVRNRVKTSLARIRDEVRPLLASRLEELAKLRATYEEQVERVGVAEETLENLLKSLGG